MLPVLFSFGGWQQGSFVAGAARRRDVAVGILVGVVVVVVAYLTVNLAFLDLLGFEGCRNSEAIGADAARVALEPFGFGASGERVLAALVVLSSLGIMNTICLAPPYVLHTMSLRGVFPTAVGHLHPTTGAPVVAVLVQGLWGIVLLAGAHFVFARDIGFLIDGVVFVDWMFFGLCGLAFVRLRARGVGDGGYRAPKGGVIAVVFTLLAFAVTIGAILTRPEASGVGLGICLLGLPLFLVWSRRGAR